MKTCLTRRLQGIAVWHCCSFVLLFLLCAPLCHAEGPSLENTSQSLAVYLPDSLQCKEGAFYLGEYARIEGTADLVARASMILIEPTGNRLSRDEIIRALSLGGLAGIEVKLSVPREITLIPESPVAGLLRRKTDWSWRIEVQGVEYSEAGKVSVPSARIVPGTRNLTVLVGGKEGKPQRRQVKLTWYQPVLFARRNLLRGEALRSEDMLLRIAPVHFMETPLSAYGEALGNSLRRAVPAGRVVMVADIVRSEGIRARQGVLILGQVGGIYISTQGIALESGNVGSIIRVKNISSKKIVHGRIIDSNRVEIRQEGKNNEH